MINLANISYIEDTDGKKAVIIALDDYKQIQERLEELEDIEDYHKIKDKKEETFPMDVVEKLVFSEESKIKILRKYRKLSVTALAKNIGVSEPYLSQIENLKRKGNIDLYKKIAISLNVDVDMLI